jgi:hypothetical protein
MTIIQTEPSVREQQLAAVQALAALLEIEDLPAVSWDISASRSGVLDGIIPAGQDDAGQREAVARWAEFLGVDVVEQARGNDGKTWTTVTASADYMGARVKVWARVDVEAVSA